MLQRVSGLGFVGCGGAQRYPSVGHRLMVAGSMWERPWPRSGSNGQGRGSARHFHCLIIRFRPYGEFLLAVARTAGPAKRNQKVLPRHTARLRRVPSLHHCSRGRRTRAVPGPLRLSPHPCGSLPSTTIAFGLLERGVVPARIYCFDAGRCWLLFLMIVPTRSVGTIKGVHKTYRRCGLRVPSGGRVEVLCRGAFGMDAKRGTMGQGWPFVTTLGTVPERGKSGRRSDP